MHHLAKDNKNTVVLNRTIGYMDHLVKDIMNTVVLSKSNGYKKTQLTRTSRTPCIGYNNWLYGPLC